MILPGRARARELWPVRASERCARRANRHRGRGARRTTDPRARDVTRRYKVSNFVQNFVQIKPLALQILCTKHAPHLHKDRLTPTPQVATCAALRTGACLPFNSGVREADDPRVGRNNPV